MPKVSSAFGTVIRTDAAADAATVRSALESMGFTDEELQVGDRIIVVGPVFGGDVAKAIATSLERIDLEYWDDFYTFEDGFPDWLTLHASRSNA